jgi:hypothetical protein
MFVQHQHTTLALLHVLSVATGYSEVSIISLSLSRQILVRKNSGFHRSVVEVFGLLGF